MKKRIAIALCMLMTMLMLGACGTDPTTVDYNGMSYEDLQTDMDNSISMVQSLAQLFAENDLTADTLSDDIAEQLSTNYGVTQEQIDASASWQECLDELGEVREIRSETFTVTKSGKTLTTDETIVFATRNVNFEVVYDYYSMDITGISVDPVYSLGEKMGQAAVNTVISISVVFVVLILISLIIYGFKIFPYLEERKKAKEREQAMAMRISAPAPVPVPAAQAPVQRPAADTELAAVIAAAVAASTGMSTSDFVVRSINRR